jgi:phenylalanine-4-hydroxylase
MLRLRPAVASTMLSSQAQIDENAPAELMHLDADHPGFHDAVYRRRRNEIARAALHYREGEPVPSIGYTEKEHDVWAEVWRHLDPLHERYACRAYRDAGDRIALSRERIPQLATVNATIQPLLGFRMAPVAGLVAAKSFLSQLGRDVFLSTQYMRHHSVPLYTPEPDVVHELIGHAATFADPTFVALNRAFGEAALRAHDDQETIDRIGRLYWYTLEFGVVREGGRLRVYGAGLLSSFGELGRFEREEELLDWNVDDIAATPYDPTQYQQKLFIAPSLDAMADDVQSWLRRVPVRP